MAAAKTGKIMTLWLHTLELELVICTDDFELWLWSQTLSYRNCRDAVNFLTQFFEVRNGIFLVKKLQWNEFLVTMPLCCCLFFFFVNDAVIIKTPVRFNLAFALLVAAIVFSFLVDRCCYCLIFYDKFMSRNWY